MEGLKLPKAEGAMVEVGESQQSRPAAAGCGPQDVIVEFDGERVRSALHLTRVVSETPVGRDVTFSVMRDGKKIRDAHQDRSGQLVRPAVRRDYRFGSDAWIGQEIGRQAREMTRNLPEIVDGARAG
jgi:hypothetical protein